MKWTVAMGDSSVRYDICNPDCTHDLFHPPRRERQSCCLRALSVHRRDRGALPELFCCCLWPFCEHGRQPIGVLEEQRKLVCGLRRWSQACWAIGGMVDAYAKGAEMQVKLGEGVKGVAGDEATMPAPSKRRRGLSEWMLRLRRALI